MFMSLHFLTRVIASHVLYGPTNKLLCHVYAVRKRLLKPLQPFETLYLKLLLAS